MDLAPDFDEFCALLNARSVEFVIVGAHALAFHGAPRFTGNLDILVRPTEENGQRLLDAIVDFGCPTAPVTPSDIVAGRKVVEMGVPPVQIHVMSAIDGVEWADVWTTREPGTLGTQNVAFIGRECFLRNKRAAGRPKDLAACRRCTTSRTSVAGGGTAPRANAWRPSRSCAECCTAIPGPLDACAARADVFDLDDVPIPVIALADLKTNKKAAGRHRDLADLENLPSRVPVAELAATNGGLCEPVTRHLLPGDQGITEGEPEPAVALGGVTETAARPRSPELRHH